MQLSKPRMALPGEGTTQKRCFLNEKHKSKVQPQPSPFQSDEVLMSEAGRQPAGDGEEEAEAEFPLGTWNWDQYTPHCSQGGWKTPPLITHHHQHKKNQPRLKTCSLLGLLWEPWWLCPCPPRQGHHAQGPAQGCHRSVAVFSLQAALPSQPQYFPG